MREQLKALIVAVIERENLADLDPEATGLAIRDENIDRLMEEFITELDERIRWRAEGLIHKGA